MRAEASAAISQRVVQHEPVRTDAVPGRPWGQERQGLCHGPAGPVLRHGRHDGQGGRRGRSRVVPGLRARHPGLRSGASGLLEAVGFGLRTLLGSDAEPARRRSGQPAHGRDAGQDLRPAWMVLGHQRGGPDAPAHGGGAAAGRPLEHGTQVHGRVQRLGGHAPAQPRAQQGHAGGLAEGGRRLRQDPERASRAGRNARVLARGHGLVGGDCQRDPARDTAVGRLSDHPARSPEGLDRPSPGAAGAGRVLQRDVRLSDPHRTRRRPQDRHRTAPRAAGVQA